MAESLAVRVSMTFSLSRDLDFIMGLLYSQVLINTINMNEMNLEIFVVFRDIYSVSPAFKSILFKFIPRSDSVMAASVI